MAHDITKARDAHIRWYAKTYEVTPKEAILVDQEWIDGHKEELRNLEHKPADQVTWLDLDMAEDVESGLSAKVWTKLKDQAADELDCGWRSAKVVQTESWNSAPIDRARFYAVLNSFYEEWQPRPGTETILVNMLAQIYYTYEEWMRTHHKQILHQGVAITRDEEAHRRENGQYITPRASDVEALDQSAAMTDRWQRAFLRTVRALRDLRRLSSPVVIQNAEQVNVAQQQINVT